MASFLEYDPKTGRLPGEKPTAPDILPTKAGDTATPMTKFDRCMASLLSPERVTYLPASYDKRFGGAIAGLAARPNAKITPKQRALLVAKIIRYRQQIFGLRVGAFIRKAQITRDPACIEAAIIAAVSGLIR